ncbi:flagellar motor switch protein FliM [Pseudomonas syringae pv. actinidiae]|nr:flagellar motor switch protein FliM [Pseudomonas syringae pv. actinidiae]
MAVQDLLSQDEIDALLHGVDDGMVQTDIASEPGSVKSYDLTSQDRIVRGRMPTLEMINERFARYTRISMFNLLRRSADVAVGGVQVMKFGEYVHSLYVRPASTWPRSNRCAARRCSFWTPSWCSSW